jgi:hypothetical protein
VLPDPPPLPDSLDLRPQKFQPAPVIPGVLMHQGPDLGPPGHQVSASWLPKKPPAPVTSTFLSRQSIDYWVTCPGIVRFSPRLLVGKPTSAASFAKSSLITMSYAPFFLTFIFLIDHSVRKLRKKFN